VPGVEWLPVTQPGPWSDRDAK